MKEFSKNGKLTPEVMETIMAKKSPTKKEKFTFKAERLRQFIPSTVPYEKKPGIMFSKRWNTIIGIRNGRRSEVKK
jgi:hypothetical protein